MEYPENTVLLVDDEKPVLNALKRLIRPLKCTVLVTESPNEALRILDEQQIDLVISDMRMPEMSGERFLEQVAKQSPDTERIVMTAYSDPQATIDAINHGKVSRFMMKPWEDEDVLKVVRKSFELTALRRQNEALQALTRQKNAELAALNDSLEQKVEARTAQLKDANVRIKNSYRSVVRMFSNLTARRLGVKATADNHRLNQILLGVAKYCKVEGTTLKQLYYAWQLRNIGKLSFDDSLLTKPYVELSAEQQRQFHTHPLLAEAATMLVKPLFPAGNIIRQHKEYLDGSGYPKGLQGDQISQPARILCVVNDYIELTLGTYQGRQYSTNEALAYLREYASERYEDRVVDALEAVVSALAKEGDVVKDDCKASQDLAPEMVLSRDLVSGQGVLLLSAGQTLDTVAIQRIREMEANLDEQFAVYIKN